MTNPIPGLPSSILQRLTDHMPLANQRTMRRFDPRFGYLAASDWSVPLLHRLTTLLDHLESRRHDRLGDDGQLVVRLSSPSPVFININAHVFDGGDLLQSGLWNVWAMTRPPGPFEYVDEIGNRDFILGIIDDIVHTIRGEWIMRLEFWNNIDPNVVMATFAPPLFNQVEAYSVNLPVRRTRRRLV